MDDLFPFDETITIDGSPIIIDDQNSGTPEPDRLVASPEGSSISGKGGSDVIIGLGGFDLLLGDGGDDGIRGGGGGDRISGGQGDDQLFGQNGNDQLAGGAGQDRLVGGAGDDVLIGDRDSDVMVGGAGEDGFVLSARGGDRFVDGGSVLFTRSGADRIVDFEDGTDLIGIQLRQTIEFEQITIQARGSNTVIRYDQKPIAILVGVEANTITADDFANVITAL